MTRCSPRLRGLSGDKLMSVSQCLICLRSLLYIIQHLCLVDVLFFGFRCLFFLAYSLSMPLHIPLTQCLPLKLGKTLKVDMLALRMVKNLLTRTLMLLSCSRKYAAHCSIIASRFALPPFNHPAPVPVKHESGSYRLRVG